VTTLMAPTYSPVIVDSSSRLSGILYDLQGPVHKRAAEPERPGRQIPRLHIGNPAPFGLRLPATLTHSGREAPETNSTQRESI
jgi:alanine-synthesizing transaminase